MRLQLLGTGASDGWPNPWCACASCTAAATAGLVRGQTSALLDGRLLLEIGAEAPRAALRHGTSLAGVEAVLVTHAHPDHHAWPAWMWRGWAPGRRPVTLVAPPAVIADARTHLDSTVTTTEVSAGDRLSIAGHQVVVLPARHAGADAGPAVLYDVTGPDGTRLLWGCDTGELPSRALELAAGRRYDVVLLELTSAHLPHHLDLRSWPLQVAALRRCGAVTDATQLLAVHLGHDNPPPAQLDRALAAWGARAPVDGEVVDVGAPLAHRPPSRRTLVLGAARSGKSAHAEALLAAEPAVTYLATAAPRPGDADWQDRVRAHVERRPENWTTVETAEVAAALQDVDEALLVDDLGLWLVRQLDDADGWEGAVPAQVLASCDALVVAWRGRRGPAVLVAPEVGSGVVPAHASGRRFRDLLGGLVARLAAVSDDVVQVVAGMPRALR
jgi:adenosylcobinamide kinase / adenosylcobinamide-phosphate guanylyltransferase